MKPTYTERTTCRVCGSADLQPILSLGNQYIINFPEGNAPEAGLRAPLDMVLCGRPWFDEVFRRLDPAVPASSRGPQADDESSPTE